MSGFQGRWLLTLGGLMLIGATAHAQPPAQGGYSRPTYSPYLNLTNRGGNPANNYFGIVRPQVTFQRSLQQLRGEMVSQQQQLANQQTTESNLATGHQSDFLNYGPYFMQMGRLTGPAGPSGAAPPARQPSRPARR